MHEIAKVVVDIAVGREFDYIIPAKLSKSVVVGSRITVPFGKSTKAGYVVGLAQKSDRHDLREVISLISEKPFVDEDMLRLVRWMGEYYCVPVEQAIRTVLPGAVRHRKAGFKEQLLVSTVEDAGKESDKPGPRKLSAGQTAVMALLRSRGPVFLSELAKEAGVTVSPVRTLARKGLVKIESVTSLREPLAARNILQTEPLALMPEQEAALVEIRQCIDDQAQEHGAVQKQGVVLLYGVTGSGKTEVYLQSIAHVLHKGRKAIVLVPEISLTPQTVERFVARFGRRVAVLHSHLSQGERHDEWHRIRDGNADIVIGARSAVFAPVGDLGLIVVDEEHEPSYKQEDAPRYNARDVAVMRASIEKCAVVLGSATPSMESRHNARKGKYRLAVLRRRVDNRRMPSMRIVDMRIEAERSGHVTVFSKDLLTAIQQRLDRAEQSILFLNRRGYATSIICPNCGFVAGCDNCSVSYTYHRKDEELHCHICGGTRKVPARCPGCSDPAFRYAGIGTQRVENIVKKCFPNAGIQRMDTDMTSRKGSYDKILGDFRVGKIDILIGTQMIAKGLHFPNVTLVGVIYADLSLHMPDFRAGERTFQLLAQVAGRAGRGEVPGEVIVQTYTPFHPAVQAARRMDYDGFCDQESEFRKELNYPPFSHLVCLTLKGRSEEKLVFHSRALAAELRSRLPPAVVCAGPTPAPLARAKGYYRYQIMLRCTSARKITDPVKTVMKEFRLPPGITCSVDVDAINLL